MATKPTNLPAGSPGFSNNNNGRVPLPPKGVPVTTTKNNNTSTVSSNSSGAGMVGLNSTKLQSGQEMANIFGHIFGYDNIYKILQDASKEKFGALENQTMETRDRYLTDMANQQQGIMDNSRNIRQNAVRTGLSKGSNVAAEVMQQMASQQQSAGVQQEYRSVLNDINNQHASQKGADIYNAMATQNELASQLGNLAVTDRASSVQELMSRLSYNADIDANNASRYATSTNAALGQKQLDAQMGFHNALVAMGVPDADAWGIIGSADQANALSEWRTKKTKEEKPTFKINYNQPSTNTDRHFDNDKVKSGF